MGIERGKRREEGRERESVCCSAGTCMLLIYVFVSVAVGLAVDPSYDTSDENDSLFIFLKDVKFIM